MAMRRFIVHVAQGPAEEKEEGESIPAIFKGIAKIALIRANCNIDAGLGAVAPV